MGQEEPMPTSISRVTGGRPCGREPSAPADTQRNPVVQSRALVAIASTVPVESGPISRRAHAPFLAHLIATREGIAQTRLKRRAAPERGAAAYRAGLTLRRPQTNHKADHDA
jgi:hypothetical protein